MLDHADDSELVGCEDTLPRLLSSPVMIFKQPKLQSLLGDNLLQVLHLTLNILDLAGGFSTRRSLTSGLSNAVPNTMSPASPVTSIGVRVRR